MYDQIGKKFTNFSVLLSFLALRGSSNPKSLMKSTLCLTDCWAVSEKILFILPFFVIGNTEEKILIISSIT